MADPPRLLAHSPGFRNLVHFAVFFAVGLPLLLVMLVVEKLDTQRAWLPYLPFWIAGFLSTVTLFNLFVLPHVPLLNLVMREKEGWNSGIWMYPCSLAVCFVIFPPYAAFGAWAVMACGDAPASFFGRLIAVHKLPWNAKKTYAGFGAFVLFATAGAYLTLFLMPCPLFVQGGWPLLPYVWTLAVLAALSGALAESADVRLDDNARVPFASAGTIVAAAYFLKFSTQSLPESTHVRPQNLVHALIANGMLGVAVLLFRFADFPATVLGMALGTLIYFYANWQGYVLFGLFVGLGSALSKMELKKKTEERTAEANEGKRGVANVAANLLVPALCCALYPLLHGRPSLLMAFAGAIAAALADTASSEIGVLSPQEPRLITTFKPVPHGTNGAVSLLGTTGAVVACTVITFAAYGTGFVQLASGSAKALSSWVLAGACTAIFLAGLFGTAVDSLLGATVEDKFKFVGKGAVNFMCTLTGAITTGLVTEAWLFIAEKWYRG